MSKLEKVIKGLEECSKADFNPCMDRVCPYAPKNTNNFCDCRIHLLIDALELLKEQKAKPLCCKECSYHRNDGWCNEHRREVKESDYCSFGAWEGR